LNTLLKRHVPLLLLDHDFKSKIAKRSAVAESSPAAGRGC